MYLVIVGIWPFISMKCKGIHGAQVQNKLVVFNHRVCYLGCIIALETVVMKGVFCVMQLKRQLPSSSYNHNTLTTFKTFVRESLQMHTSKLQ